MTETSKTSKPIHVLFFTGTLGTGGSEAHLTRLLVGLSGGPIQPELMLIRAAKSHQIDQVREAGVPIHDLGVTPGRSGVLPCLAGIRKTIGAIRPEFVHTYGYPCDVYAPLIATMFPKTRVVTTRRGEQPLARRRLLYRATNPLVQHVLCVAQSAEDFAVETERLSRDKSDVIPNGVDTEEFVPLPEVRSPAKVVGTHGRIAHIKGSDLLLDAFKELGDDRLTLSMAGPDGEAWGTQLREARQADPGVDFLGGISDVRGFLESVDLYVLPSRSEGMSVALLEAMAMGLPIIATDVGSNRELLANGEAGLVVPPTSGAIAAALKSLLDDPERARQLAQAARKRAETVYSLKNMVQRHERFYAWLTDGSAHT